MSVFVCALLWSSSLGWCRPAFCFHQGKVKWATWYPHCALSVGAEGMELRGWNCTSKVAVEVTCDYLIPSPPSNILERINVRLLTPLLFLLVSLCFPINLASLPARPDSIQRDPWGWLSSLGPFQISEHDATASGPISLMLSALIFSVTHVRSYSTKARKQTKSTAGSTLEIGSQSNSRNDPLVELCAKVVTCSAFAASLAC